MNLQTDSERLFIADLHLSAERPATLARFQAFLAGPPVHAEALYILGDLFDAWIGDDDPSPLASQVRESLATLTQQTPVFLQRGNRDFLLGDAFLDATGCKMLDEETVVQSGPPSNPSRLLLMHGDLLCTDDVDYQQARQMLRNPAFIADFLSKPLAERSKLATEFRRRSGEAMSLKASDIMDVNQQAVETALARHQASTLIHGHTHRPGKHEFLISGVKSVRYVLGEWHEDRGMYLRLQNNRIDSRPC